MELFIKVYETCPVCKGEGWIKEEGENALCYNCPMASGKVKRIIKIEELIDNIRTYIELK